MNAKKKKKKVYLLIKSFPLRPLRFELSVLAHTHTSDEGHAGESVSLLLLLQARWSELNAHAAKQTENGK